MSTTTSPCVCDDSERYERIQITLIVLACISGVLALVSMIIYLKEDTIIVYHLTIIMTPLIEIQIHLVIYFVAQKTR